MPQDSRGDGARSSQLLAVWRCRRAAGRPAGTCLAPLTGQYHEQVQLRQGIWIHDFAGLMVSPQVRSITHIVPQEGHVDRLVRQASGADARDGRLPITLRRGRTREGSCGRCEGTVRSR